MIIIGDLWQKYQKEEDKVIKQNLKVAQVQQGTEIKQC